MKDKLFVIVYFVLFMVLSVAVSGVLFLFAFPLSILVLLGLVAWAIGEALREIAPFAAKLFGRTVTAAKSRLSGGLVQVSDVESGRHASIQNLVVLRRHSRPSVPAQLSVQHTRRLRFVQSSRRVKGLQRFAFHALRRPHHAHSHSR